MSSSSDFFASRRFSRKATSFSVTCSKLSKYLKKNGSFGDLSLEMTCKSEVNGGFGISRHPTTTMSLFPCEASNIDSMTATQDLIPENLFSSSPSSLPKKEVLKKTQTKTAPLTIFYAGEVIVFNDFSPKKAKEVMNLATKGTSGFTSNVNNNNFHSDLTKNQTEIGSNIDHVRNHQELPIVRRASLHRFLAKRKNRVTSKAPYQLCDPAKASSKSKTGDNKTSWLGLAAEI